MIFKWWRERKRKQGFDFAMVLLNNGMGLDKVGMLARNGRSFDGGMNDACQFVLGFETAMESLRNGESVEACSNLMFDRGQREAVRVFN